MNKILAGTNNLELAELYRLTRALLSLRDLFDGAYERAVLAMLPEATKARLQHALNATKDSAASAARPILDDSYEALEAVFEEYNHDVAESLLATALADTVASLPEKLDVLEQTLRIASSG